MSESATIIDLLRQDQRFHIEAYEFVREALSYAQNVVHAKKGPDVGDEVAENHITGQQLCESIRLFAVEQFGFMALTVLNSWGIHSTSDFGEIVYNMIRIGLLKKSDSDRREDFDNVYEFPDAFDPVFQCYDPPRD